MTDSHDEVGAPAASVRGPDPEDAGDFQYDEAHLAADGGPGIPGQVPDQPDQQPPTNAQ
jgi:hypothetical protein